MAVFTLLLLNVELSQLLQLNTVWEFKNLLLKFSGIKKIILLLWLRKLILQETQVNGIIDMDTLKERLNKYVKEKHITLSEEAIEKMIKFANS